MRYYIDEDPPQLAASALRKFDRDAVSTTEAGNKGFGDARQLLFAVQTGRVLVTCNKVDFRMLHEAWILWTTELGSDRWLPHPGILIVPSGSELRADALARLLDEFADGAGDTANRLFEWTRLNGWRELTRLR